MPEASPLAQPASQRAVPRAQPLERSKPAAHGFPSFPELVSLGIVFAQVALLAAIMRALDMETSAFRRMVQIAAGGFVANHLLPQRFRLAFFGFLSIAALGIILGGTPSAAFNDLSLSLPRTAAILLLGAVIIGVCHLPIGFWKRAGLLVAIGAVVAVFRAGIFESGRIAIVWPLLAAMFMFRVIVYLYDVSTSSQRPSKGQSVAYFFLIPNACTWLFPVIDFRTFCSKYYDEDAFVIYQRGVKWMTRGVIHLLLYHLVELVFAINISAVNDGADLVQFMVGNSLLYLRVSGTFHLCIGMLLLFGFNLPETNHRYFLAASFTDYWRRVNIYWRNFIMKVFYYPAFFRLKRMGQVKALILATLWSFFVTWALHLYQTWWVKGSVAWSAPDFLFWGTLALLVLGNSLWELKKGRKYKLAGGRYSVKDGLGLAIRTGVTFVIISVLWSLWSTPTLREWLHIMSLADLQTLKWGGLVFAVIMGATLLFEILPAGRGSAPVLVKGAYRGTARFYRDAALCAGPLLAISLSVHFLLSPRFQVWRASPWLKDLGSIAYLIGSPDDAGHGQGYYETLTAIDLSSDKQFYETMRRTPFPARYHGADPRQPVKDFRFEVLLPNTHVEAWETDFQTNRWGFRGPDVSLEKAPGTLRIAFLGSSHVMGFGVRDEQTFARLVETDLNTTLGQEGRSEVLNFGLGARSPLGQLASMQQQVESFHPNVVIFVVHLNDYDWVNRDLQRATRENIPIPYPQLNQILRDARVTGKTNELLATERLRPFESQILQFAYQQIAKECRSIDALPICVFVPPPADPLDKERLGQLLSLAHQAQFITMDLSDLYATRNAKDFMLTDAAHHSNVAAHALIATEIYNALIKDPEIDLLNRARMIKSHEARGRVETTLSNH